MCKCSSALPLLVSFVAAATIVLFACDQTDPGTAAPASNVQPLAENNNIVGVDQPQSGSLAPQSESLPDRRPSAVEEVPPPPLPVGAAPDITLERRLHDFGEIWDIEQQSASFPFTNTGDAPLIINAIKPSCGCTTTTLEKMRFEPGEGDQIGLTFKPKGFGVQQKSIKLTTNDPDEPVITLLIKAEITPFVKVDPGIYLRFDDIRQHQTHTQPVTLRSSDPDLIVEKIRAGRNIAVSPARRIETDPGGGAGPASEYTFDVTVLETAPWGPLRDRVEVITRGRTRPGTEIVEHPVVINVSGFIYNEVIAEPTLFAIGVTPPGKPFENRISLRRPSGESFRITRAEVMRSSVDGVTVEVVPTIGDPHDPAIGSAYNLVVRGDASGYDNHRVHGVVQIETDLPGDEQQMNFEFAGMIRQPG